MAYPRRSFLYANQYHNFATITCLRTFNNSTMNNNGINGYSTGANSHTNGTNGYTNGTDNYTNGTNGNTNEINNTNGTNGYFYTDIYNGPVSEAESSSDEGDSANDEEDSDSNGISQYANISPAEYTIEIALDLARNSNGEHDPTVDQYLERAITDLWYRVCRATNTYLFTDLEFSLFNYFRPQFGDTQIVRSAVARYWENNIPYEDYSQPRTNGVDATRVNGTH